MSRFRSAKSVAAVVALATLFLTSLTGVAGASGHERARPEARYTVEITNLTDAQYLTPPNFAAHTRAVDVFQVRRPASPGVQSVAENGGVGDLEAELIAAIDQTGNGVSGVGTTVPIGPGATAGFEFTSDADRFSLVAMLICTNDGFAGVDAKRLPTRDGQTRTYRAGAYDAGTEINTELRADLVPASFCGEGDGSTMSNPELAENGVIRRHRTLQGTGDLNPALDWKGPVAEVRITRHDPTPSYTIEIENLTPGQYLTPPNYALHDRSADVFQVGRPAGGPLQGLAENGDNMTMAAALEAAIDDAGTGVSGIGPGLVGPGQSISFEVESDAPRLSIVSMLICTNDGFAGLDAKRLPSGIGQQRVFTARGYDAGTEINTELRADLVPAPFCGDGDGSTMTNPELAENGVVRPHRTLQGTGDLDPGLDWRGPVMKVTVTRNG